MSERKSRIFNLQQIFKPSVKKRLILSFIAILLIPSLIIGTTAYNQSKQEIENEIISSAAQNVNLLNEVFTSFIQAKLQDLNLLSANLEAGTVTSVNGTNVGDSASVRAFLDQFKSLHPELELAWVGSDNGLYMNSPASVKNAADYDVRKRPWYKDAFDHKGQAVITAPYQSPATGAMIITMSQVTKDGKGVACISIDLGQLQKIASSVKIGKEGFVYILDQNYNYVVHPTAKLATQAKKTEVNDNLYKNESGTYDYEMNGVQKKMAFTTNKLTGWKIAGTMSQDEVTKNAMPIFNATLLVILVSIAVGAVLVYLIIRSIQAPLSRLIQFSQKVSAGDLSETVEVKIHDEMGQLAESFNQMITSLRSLALDVNENANLLAASAEELTASAEQSSKASEHIASVIQEVASGSDKQVQTVERSSESVNQLSNQISQVVENANTVSNVAVHASSKAVEGNVAIQAAVKQMDSIHETVSSLSDSVKTLGERSSEIGKIIEVITGISNQTNLLALNAAIEAARAGEHGRGFAVVADEVRQLAEQSAQSAQQINSLVAGIQQETKATVESMKTALKSVDDGMAVVNQVGGTFEEIQEAVVQVSSAAKQASTVLEQINEGSHQIVRGISLINEVAIEAASGTQVVSASAQEQLASMEEITASANSLSKMAEELQHLIAKFKVSK